MQKALLSLIKDIHYVLDQTRIFSIHTHRPYRDKKGILRYTNMGKGDQIAKDRIDKLVSDCGKMMDRVNACVDNEGYEIVKKNKETIAVLHDLCNCSKHVKKERDPIGNFKPSIGEPRVFTQFGSESGSHAGIISTKEKSFWDIGDRGCACIVIEADVLDEKGIPYKELISLVKESLKIWLAELKKCGIDMPEYEELDSMEEAEKFGQHGSLFVESYEDAHAKASILTHEKRFDEATVLYNYALTECESDAQRAECYACLGLSYEDAEEIMMAQASYITAIKYNPNMPGVHVNFGNICNILGNKNTAKSAFQKELDLPGGAHVNAHINLSLFYKELGDINDAIAHIKSALELNPNSQHAKDVYAELNEIVGKRLA